MTHRMLITWIIIKFVHNRRCDKVGNVCNMIQAEAKCYRLNWFPRLSEECAFEKKRKYWLIRIIKITCVFCLLSLHFFLLKILVEIIRRTKPSKLINGIKRVSVWNKHAEHSNADLHDGNDGNCSNNHLIAKSLWQRPIPIRYAEKCQSCQYTKWIAAIVKASAFLRFSIFSMIVLRFFPLSSSFFWLPHNLLWNFFFQQFCPSTKKVCYVNDIASNLFRVTLFQCRQTK